MNTELEFLIEIVKTAEEISKEHFEIYSKGDKGDIVTDLDIKIENFLIEKIKEKYPEFDIVSEETNSKQKLTENCFVIDPIDGTVNFSNGVPLWTIQVACVKNSEVVASVVSLPRIGEFFYADAQGAFLNGKKISVKQNEIKNCLYAIDGNRNAEAIKNMKQYASHSRNFGAVGVSQVFVACGRIQGTVFRSDKVWDYLPGMYIAKMAGAFIEDKPKFHASASSKEFLEILKKETEIKE